VLRAVKSSLLAFRKVRPVVGILNLKWLIRLLFFISIIIQEGLLIVFLLEGVLREHSSKDPVLKSCSSTLVCKDSPLVNRLEKRAIILPIATEWIQPETHVEEVIRSLELILKVPSLNFPLSQIKQSNRAVLSFFIWYFLSDSQTRHFGG